MPRRTTLIPLALALALAFFGMPGNVYRVDARGVGTARIDPWRQVPAAPGVAIVRVLGMPSSIPTMLQHVSTSLSYGGTMATNGEFRVRIPNLTQANNCLVLGFSGGVGGGGAPTISISDDAPGGTNTWNVIRTEFDGTNLQCCYLAVALNIKAGTRVLKVKNTTAGVSLNYMQAVATEFNNVATASAADGNIGTTVASGTTVAAGNITPTQTGDLLYQYTIRDASPIGTSSWTAGSQANIGWALLSADVQDGTAAQWGQYNSTSAISPTMTTGVGTRMVTAAIALKTVSAGNPRPDGIYVAAIHHYSQPGTATTMIGVTGISNPSRVQIPSVGNLLICAFTTGLQANLITGITDQGSHTWEASGSGVNNGIDDSASMWYSANRTPSSTNYLDITYNSIATDDSTVLVYDVVSAAIVQHNLEQTGSATGNETGQPATLPTCSISPVSKNGLIIFEAQWEFGTANGITLSGALFDSIEFDGMALDGPENMDQNGGWAHFYNADLTPLTCTWNMLTNGNAYGLWAAYAAAFLPSSLPIRPKKISMAQQSDASYW